MTAEVQKKSSLQIALKILSYVTQKGNCKYNDVITMLCAKSVESIIHYNIQIELNNCNSFQIKSTELNFYITLFHSHFL